MKKVVFSRRDRWCYGGAIIALLVGVALILSGHQRLGEPLCVGAVTYAIAFGIGRGHVSPSDGDEHSEQKDDAPD